MTRVIHTDRTGQQHTEEFNSEQAARNRYDALCQDYYTWNMSMERLRWCRAAESNGEHSRRCSCGSASLVRDDGFILGYYGSERGGAFIALAQSAA